MGYTHYFSILGWDSIVWQTAWPVLINDTRLILEAADVLVCGRTTSGNDDHQDSEKDGDYGEDDPMAPPTVDVDEGIWINGVADDGHEPFILSPMSQECICKTMMKPYDIVVACIMMRAYMLAPANVQARSDGKWDEKVWLDARRLYRDLWPGEVLWCPWVGPEYDEQNKYIGEDGVMPLGPWPLFFDQEDNYRGRQDLLYSTDGRYFQPEEWLRMSAAGIVRPSGMGVDEDEEVGQKWTVESLTECLKSLQLDFPAPPITNDGDTDLGTVSGIDFAPAKAWLFRCEESQSHEVCKAAPIKWTTFPGAQFKLINTEKRCIINAEELERISFIALSYVWGGDQPKLTSATAPLLMAEGGLDRVWPNLPTTIRDAIAVCEKLGEKYLWVDALCIIQDSIKDKKLQILRMRQIYSAAKCTIAAVSGLAAREGLLPATATGLKSACKSEDELDKFLKTAPWSTRAWCYQEKVLSHRMIFFTSSGIYLQCQKGTCDGLTGAELIPRKGHSSGRFDRVGAMLIPPSVPSSSTSSSERSVPEDLESYLSAVEYFSQRKLTVKDDKMNAFQGVLQRYRGRMDGRDSSFTFGLPIAAFDQTVCWRRPHEPGARNRCFPSWSWLGWDGAVTWDRSLVRHARTNQMIYHFQTHSLGDRGSVRFRKPADASSVLKHRRFGFPASGGGLFYNGEARTFAASVADLRIGRDPVETEPASDNGLYPVYPTRCAQQPPPTPPQTMSAWEWLCMPMPKLEFMDAETAAAPSLPAEKQTSKEHGGAAEHELHGTDCEARSHVLGYIWLNKEWRDAQPEWCVMEFMALHGEKDEEWQKEPKVGEVQEIGHEPGHDQEQGQGGSSQGGVEASEDSGSEDWEDIDTDDDEGGFDNEKWTITMLMLIQRMAKKGKFWASERIQIMDCRLSEEEWEKTGPELIDLKLV